MRVVHGGEGREDLPNAVHPSLEDFGLKETRTHWSPQDHHPLDPILGHLDLLNLAQGGLCLAESP